MAIDPNAPTASTVDTSTGAGAGRGSNTGSPGAPAANTAKQRHPKTTYSARYYFNKKTTSESGHEFEVDDTPGKERIRMSHRKGSYFEWNADGSKVESTKGNSTQYIQGGLTMTVDNNSDIKFNGNIRQSSGSKHEEVKGTSSTNVSEGYALNVNGGASIYVKEDGYVAVVGKLTIKASEINIVSTSGSIGLESAADINLVAKGGISLNAKGGKVYTKSSGPTKIEADSTLDTLSGGGTTITAPRINLKSG